MLNAQTAGHGLDAQTNAPQLIARTQTHHIGLRLAAAAGRIPVRPTTCLRRLMEGLLPASSQLKTCHPSCTHAAGRRAGQPGRGAFHRRLYMSVARVVEITATSEQSFEDALQQGVARATQTLRNVRSAWVKEQEVQIQD